MGRFILWLQSKNRVYREDGRPWGNGRGGRGGGRSEFGFPGRVVSHKGLHLLHCSLHGLLLCTPVGCNQFGCWLHSTSKSRGRYLYHTYVQPTHDGSSAEPPQPASALRDAGYGSSYLLPTIAYCVSYKRTIAQPSKICHVRTLHTSVNLWYDYCRVKPPWSMFGIHVKPFNSLVFCILCKYI